LNTGAPDRQSAALLLETEGLDDYRLVDSGHGRKLERFGARTLIRPEEQAIWAPRLPETVWEKADASFTGDTDEEGAGRWKRRGGLDEEWTCRHGAVTFACRLTSFRHVGAFPEQEAHWRVMEESLSALANAGGDKPQVLNLFGYTGLASLIAAAAGAEVTHVDASKKAIAWARENQALSGMENLPVRWICEDAMKFAAREVRRGRRYQCILLDPPKFGRGPKNEVWRVFDDLPEMIDLCRQMIDPERGLLLLTSYAIRSSFLMLEELCLDGLVKPLGGTLDSGELVLRGEDGRRLSTSLFSRWSAA
jgi:23S rRNA (cytosine1962-C5)-methyltransferase